MKTKLEKIDILIERTNADYKQAKEALDATNDDVVEAIIYLEKNGCSKRHNCNDKDKRKPKYAQQPPKKSMSVVISDNEKDLLNLPIIPFIILAFIFTPFVIGGVILALILGLNIQIDNGETKNNSTDIDEYETPER